MSATWPRVPLGEIFTIARGGSPRPIDDYITDSEDGINWIMIGDAVEGTKYIRATKKKIRRAGVERSRMVKPGDFLLTNSMSFGKPYILQTDGCIHDGWLVLSPREPNVCQDYFYHLLGSDGMYSEFAKRASGAVVKNLNIDLVKGVEVPLPPLEDQKRIAAILDKADTIRRNRKQALRLTDDFLRSVFLDMFGDPVTNPKALPKVPLGEVFKVKSGNGLIAKDMVEGGIHPVYGGNGISGYHDSYMFEEPKIVIGRVGAYCGAVHYTEPQSWVTDNALYIETMKRPMNEIYLLHALRFANLNQYAGQAGQPLISGGRIYPVEILEPPEHQQVAFATTITKAKQTRQLLQGGIKDSASLFSSLQQRAFSGKL